MPLNYSYGPQEGCIHIVGDGAVSLDDRIHFVRRLLDDTALPPVACVLIDVNAVTTAPAAQDLRTIGLLVERLQARFRGRVAIVNVTVGHVTLSHLVAWSVGDGASQVRVFGSEGEARDWLRA